MCTDPSSPDRRPLPADQPPTSTSCVVVSAVLTHADDRRPGS